MTEQDRQKGFAMRKIAKSIKTQIEAIKKSTPNISIDELMQSIDLHSVELSEAQQKSLGDQYIKDLHDNSERFAWFCKNNNIDL